VLNVNKSWTEDERSGRSLKGSSDSRPMAAIEAPRAQRSLYCAVVALRRRPSEDANDPVDLPPAVPDEVIRVLSVLPSASIVTAPNGDVLRASARALVNRNSLAVPDVSRLVERVADDGEAREQEMRVRRPPLGRELLELRVRVAPLGTGVLLVLVDDLAEERRVDAVRRDFVANVSHELKTPVGALSLLAETVLACRAMTR
jgi:two-component system sensor histidine kinase SenX3